MIRIYLFGGSFNPFHRGHLALADHVLTMDPQAELWLLPTSFPPHKKQKDFIADHHRLAMIELSIHSLDSGKRKRCRIECYEMGNAETNYTINTLKHLKNEHGWNEKPYLMIGDDWVPLFDKWKNAQEVSENSKLLIFHRLWTDKKILAFPHEYLNNDLVEVSSSNIRESIRSGSPDPLAVVPEVAEYMEQHGLYRTDQRD